LGFTVWGLGFERPGTKSYSLRITAGACSTPTLDTGPLTQPGNEHSLAPEWTGHGTFDTISWHQPPGNVFNPKLNPRAAPELYTLNPKP